VRVGRGCLPGCGRLPHACLSRASAIGQLRHLLARRGGGGGGSAAWALVALGRAGDSEGEADGEADGGWFGGGGEDGVEATLDARADRAAASALRGEVRHRQAVTPTLAGRAARSASGDGKEDVEGVDGVA